MDVDTVSSTPAEIDKAELELDELDDGYDSGTSDVNTFKIRQPLNPPSAKIFSTKDLHGTCFLCRFAKDGGGNN